MVALARDQGHTQVFVPAVDGAEAALVEGVTVLPAESLAQVVSHLRDEVPMSPYDRSANGASPDPRVNGGPSLEHVKGQEHASAPWRWRRQAGTTSCCWALPEAARPSWPALSLPSCRR